MRTDAESCRRCHGWSLASLSDSEIPDDDVFCNLGYDGDAVRQQVLADVGQIKQQLMCLHEVLRVPTGSFGDALNSSSPSERVTPEAVFVSESQHLQGFAWQGILSPD